MYDENFDFICGNSNVLKELLDEETRNFLFHGKKDVRLRLYIHLTNKEDTTFYCIYKEAEGEGYEFEYPIEKIITEAENKLQSDKMSSIFYDLRNSLSISFDQWEESCGPIPFKEEREFLKELNP